LVSCHKEKTQIGNIKEQDAEENILTYERGSGRRLEKTA
jgi:hypothetical protein